MEAVPRALVPDITGATRTKEKTPEYKRGREHQKQRKLIVVSRLRGTQGHQDSTSRPFKTATGSKRLARVKLAAISSARQLRSNTDLSSQSIFTLVESRCQSLESEDEDIESVASEILNVSANELVEIQIDATAPAENAEEENALIMNANDIANLMAQIENQRQKRVNPKDFPMFSGYGDAYDHMVTFERFSNYYGMNDDEKAGHFGLGLGTMRCAGTKVTASSTG